MLFNAVHRTLNKLTPQLEINSRRLAYMAMTRTNDSKTLSASELIKQRFPKVDPKSPLGEILKIKHPQLKHLWSVGFAIEEGDFESVHDRYREKLATAEPLQTLLKNHAIPDKVETIKHTHEYSSFLGFTTALTPNGPIIQRYMSFLYDVPFGCTTSAEGKMLTRQLASVYIGSMMGNINFFVKTDTQSFENKMVLNRRFIKGIDLMNYRDTYGLDKLKEIAKGIGKDKLLSMAVTMTMLNALDSYVLRNAIVADHSEVVKEPIVAIDHELTFPDESLCKSFKEKNPLFEWNEGDPIPNTFTDRQVKSKENRIEFAKKWFESNDPQCFEPNDPWLLLLKLAFDGNIEECLQAELRPEDITTRLQAKPVIDKLLQIFQIDDNSRQSFNHYYDMIQKFHDTKQPLRLIDILAPR